METQDDVLVQGNPESSGPATGEPSILAPLPSDPGLPTGPTPNEAIQQAAGVTTLPDGTKGLSNPPESGPPKPPEGYEGVPPELWPGPDGKPPVLTEALMRKLRGKYFTVVHPVLKNCGHKFDTVNEPRTNCENCWFQFYNTHPGLVEVTDQFRRTQGRGPLIAMRGLEYVKMFERYMATIIALMQQERALREANKEQTGILEGASQDAVPVPVQQAT